MRKNRDHRPPPALNGSSLNDLALRYVARFATSQHKLRQYMVRKLRERGWDGDGDAADAVEAAILRIGEMGYVDDVQYATMRSGAMQRRGLGVRRIAQTLHFDGIAPPDQAAVLEAATDNAAVAALAFARRKRLGPFAAERAIDPKLRQSQFAAFLRAGHAMGLTRRILAMDPGDDPDPEMLGE